MRRTTARRTQGTDSKAARPACRSTLKKLPASRGAALARMVGTLLRARSPSSWMLRMGNIGLRISQATPAASSPAPASAKTAVATPFISRTSSGSATARHPRAGAGRGRRSGIARVAVEAAVATASQARCESRLACCSRCRHSCS